MSAFTAVLAATLAAVLAAITAARTLRTSAVFLSLLSALLLVAPAHAAPPTVASAAQASLLASEAARNKVRDEARDEFLRTHRWNDRRNNWHVLRVAPRNVTAMSVTQLRTENGLLRQTHRWDADSGQWLPRGQDPAAPR